MTNTPATCYLCGLALVNPTNRDHVPPKQLYSDDIRRVHSPQLLTIQVHAACNKSFQNDEDYFANTLAPLAKDSYSGKAYLKEVWDKYAKGQEVNLVHKVLNEFDLRPSGLALPDGVVLKRFDGRRLHRVAWKIVRGLYFHNFGDVLPESTPNHIQIIAPDTKPPDIFSTLVNNPSRGQYPGVFDYKYTTFIEAHSLNYWAMLLWDKIILLISFHDIKCNCDECTQTSN